MMKSTTLTFLLLALLSLSSFTASAVPPTLSYQGYLTDADGSPIDGTVSVTFTLYDAPAAVVENWTETRVVTVSQGLFQVQLGTGTPLPLGLFDIPLWLGLQVAGDAEMIPRQALSATPYAHQAENAETLGGMLPADYDQSSHVNNSSNPHNVTARQTGAANVVILNAHTSNSSNPHSVTAAQAGAASSTDLTNHSSDSAAHHSAFTSTEAIAAMEPKADNNPLHHDKYLDSNAVLAIKADNGIGLNADTVDNLHANEIIAAASDEVRTPISSLPFTITTSGSYYLTQNLTGTSGGINVTVDKVTIDLMGFTLEGNSVADYGINQTGKSAVIIKNGTISGFGNAGIYNGSQLGDANVVSEVQVIGNGNLGSTPLHSGIYLVGSSHRVERCIAKDNGGPGIYVGTNSIINDNSAENSGGDYGIYGRNGATLNNNTAYFNQGTYGIYGANGATLSNNAAYNNRGVGIYGGHGTTLSNNSAYDNQGWGIFAETSNTVIGNTVLSNNQASNVGQGGLRIGFDSQVENNTANFNHSTGIYVVGDGNILRKNHSTNSTGSSRCIYFSSSDNAAIDNTANGCNTEFAGSLPPASRFIGNIGW